jgi:hypothetical protein
VVNAVAPCLPSCLDHPEHVYILCYGQPVLVLSRDYLDFEREKDQPISHYVGYTGQQPPVKRIYSHGKGSTGAIASIIPGTIDDEDELKGDCKLNGVTQTKRTPR